MRYNVRRISAVSFYGKILNRFLALAAALLLSGHSLATGTWIPVTNQAPDNIDTMLLLPDGTVMGTDGTPNAGGVGNSWFRLTPDSNGSYANGTWTTLAPMNDTRLYYSSQVLTNGSVFVAGGEDGTGGNTAEVYNPQANTWTYTPPPPAGQGAFSDSISEILPDGNVLIAPVTPANYGETVIYNVALNELIAGPTLVNDGYQDEASWVKLADNSILTIDPFGTDSERFIPSLNEWVNDAIVPVEIYDSVYGEMGPGFLLPNGQAIFTGATGNTAIYTPSGSSAMGSWAAGPVLPDSMVTADAPGAMMVNGKILLSMSPLVYTNATSFYEYDPNANAFTAVNGPADTASFGQVSYAMRMLDLPDGTILLSDTSSQLYIYQPDGSPLAAGQPTIKSLTKNGDGSYHLTGTLLTGISEGAAYGDDAQMNSNYPLVRLTNSVGQVYYARTYNWNTTSIMTGTNIETTEFVLPANVPHGIYSLVVTANGNASAPVTLVYSPDALLVGNTNSLFFSGTTGGPFSPASVSFTLTNVGASSLNWSLGNTSTWLTASSTSGALTPGGPTTTVTMSLKPAANSLPFGTYQSTIRFTNTTDHFVQSEVFTLVVLPLQLVQNGGFETGDFTDWTQSGINDGYEFVYGDPSYAHSGNNCALFKPQGGISYLSQNIPTTPGQLYLISFWILNYYNITPSQFSVTWAGNNLFNINPIPITNYAWTNQFYLAYATSSSSTLQFGVEYQTDPNNGDYFGLDDVSVIAVNRPSFMSLAKNSSSVNLMWTTVNGPMYQLQYATNLTQAVWTNIGSPVSSANGIATATDTTATDTQRFYRLILIP